MISGSLLIDKEVGKTSRQTVNDVSHKIKERKAGHIGTLDPFADGLLIVLLGSSTKISPFLETMDKRYLATLRLGKKTDSGDLTGNVIEEKNIPELTKLIVEKTLEKFLGEQRQLPPMYSAIKVQGKELYKYARQGLEIERKERIINIYDIKLLTFDGVDLVFAAHVSKGTYIRTLGEDIAEALGTVGHLTKLTRISVGPYSLKDAKKVSEISEDDLLPIEKMLAHIPSVLLSGEDVKKAMNGMQLKLPSDEDLVLIKNIDGIIAIYKKQSNGVYSCLRGLR